MASKTTVMWMGVIAMAIVALSLTLYRIGYPQLKDILPALFAAPAQYAPAQYAPAQYAPAQYYAPRRCTRLNYAADYPAPFTQCVGDRGTSVFPG